MKAVISSTYDSKYLYFLPITVFCWNKLNVDVICFMPDLYLDGANLEEEEKLDLIGKVCKEQGLKISYNTFSAPEHKEATYAQCSRLYGACLDLPEDEVLVTSDIDMAVFSGLIDVMGRINSDDYTKNMMTVLGKDLVPEGQIPVCYTWASVKEWRKAFIYIYGKGAYDTEGVKTYQQYLDLLLGDIETENFRGNYWSKDQEELFKIFRKTPHVESNRSNGQNQFAQNRVDRTDTNWRAYVNDDLIDAHLWRDGYTEQNHANIMELMRMKFPFEDFTWLENYRSEYLRLL